MTSHTYTLREIAEHIRAELRGDPHYKIHGIASLDHAGPTQITFLSNPKLRHHLATTQAGAIIINATNANLFQGNALILADPYCGYAKTASLFYQAPQLKPGIHPTAMTGEACKIAKTAAIGAHCVIGDHVTIGENAILQAGCIIGDNVEIGSDTLLWARVTVYYGVKIGDRNIIHSGVVIGADGFGMAPDKGVWVKIPQLGTVIIGNDVEIGANTTIDRGALQDTVIEDGVKLDNQIQVAHNVHIGAHTAIAACTAIAGSTRIGKHCIIGGAVSITGHIEIVDHVILVGTATVETSITTPGVYGSGTGLMPFRDLKKNIIRFRHLDEMARRLNKLEQAQHECDGR